MDYRVYVGLVRIEGEVVVAGVATTQRGAEYYVEEELRSYEAEVEVWDETRGDGPTETVSAAVVVGEGTCWRIGEAWVVGVPVTRARLGS